MAILNRAIPTSELHAFGLTQILDEPPAENWVKLHTRLAQAASQTEPDNTFRKVLDLLRCAVSMHLQPKMGAPLKPRRRNGDKSTGGPENLGTHDVDCLLKVATGLKSAWARAQLADVALVSGQALGMNVREAGTLAAKAYLEACEDGFDAMAKARRILRGLNLAWQFSREDTFPALCACLETRLAEAVETHHLGDAFALAEEVLQRTLETSLHLGPLFESLAESLSAAGKGDSYSIARCYDFAAKFWKQQKQDAEAKRCEVAAGMEFCKRSELPNLSSALAAEWLSTGISRLQKARVDQDLIKNLKDRLAEVRARIPDEMKKISVPFDGTNLAKHVDQAVTAAEPFVALVQIAFHTANLPSYTRSRDDILSSSDDGLASYFPSIHVNDRGEPVHTREALSGADEDRVYSEMVSNVARWWVHSVGSVVAPMASEIYSNRFSPSLQFFLEVAYTSSAVPDGHEYSVAKGLLSGVNGDWHDAGTYLIPQVEAIVRTILKKRGAVTLADKDKDDTVEEKGLHTLLDEFGDHLLGKDLTLTLRALMTDGSGCKLRHLYAHGLMADDEIASTAVSTLWWVMLRIVVESFCSSVSPVGSPASIRN